MEIGQPTQNPIGPGAAPAQPGASPLSTSSDFETFLRMLTTQMENQDPLNPIESADYAVQLATFSGVEQQVRTNQLLEGLAQQMNLTGMAQMAGWVGMEARTNAPAQFDGAPVTLFPSPAATADETVLLVRDASGALVDRIPVPVSSEPMTWAGMDENGNPRDPGLYSFELESYAHGDLLSTDPVDTYSRISEVRAQDGQTVLVLEGGVQVPASAVSALREPA